MQLAVAAAGPLCGQLAQPRPHRPIAARPLRRGVPPRPGQGQQPAGATGTDGKGGQEMGDGLPPLSRRHHFRPTTSLSIGLSSARSATSLFNRRFSSSSCFNRLASSNCSPAYLARQRTTVFLLTPWPGHFRQTRRPTLRDDRQDLLVAKPTLPHGSSSTFRCGEEPILLGPAYGGYVKKLTRSSSGLSYFSEETSAAIHRRQKVVSHSAGGQSS